MPNIVHKTKPARVAPSHPIGTLLPGNSETSKLEEQVRTRLEALGVDLVGERFGVQCGFDAARNRYPVLTPDLIVAGSQVCIEVDPSNTHQDRVEQDLVRNELLAGAGWRVVRLRLGGLEALGEWDVVSDSGTLTVAAVPALVDAIADATAGRPGTVRTVMRRPPAPRKKSRLGAIREDPYKFGVHDMTWELESGENLHMAVVDAGRYLGRVDKSEFPRFVRPLDLEGTPNEQWRRVLEPLLESRADSEFEVVSTFPWGDSLFLGPQAEKIRLGHKFSPFGPKAFFTVNLEGVAELDAAVFEDSTGKVLAELHPAVIALGWEIQSVEALTGRHGDYQEVTLIRKGFEE